MRGCLRRSGVVGHGRNRLIRQRHGLMQEAVLERDGGDDMTRMYRPMLGAMVFLASGLAIPAGLSAQGAAPPPVSSQPVPGELEMAKLIWSTMVAVDQANRSSNYSVLRDISAPAFQIANDPGQLARIFAGLRASGTDLSNTLLLAPTYRAPPAIVSPGVMRVQGYFGLRPTAVNFDFSYQWVEGRWRLVGVSIAPASLGTVQPGDPEPLQTAPEARPGR